MICPLCANSKTTQLDIPRPQNYFICTNCDLHFLDSDQHLTSNQEIDRYLLHNHDPNDQGHKDFLKPAFNEIEKRCVQSASGLDFGAGKAPVLAEMLQASGYQMSVYDPFFWPDTQFLNKTYDFVCATEVAEHFFNPAAEFLKLRQLLQKNGVLVVMTLLKNKEQDFATWYYAKDPTHVVFYSTKTFDFIREHFQFSKLEIISDRLIVLSV